jgi:2-amino-4-hydroxy-6-hydroxymethyldihydropteridine diphosphokinase
VASITYYLLLGSNIQNPFLQLEKARGKIVQLIGTIEKSSLIYLTDAWGNTSQPPFLNQVIAIRSTFVPEKMLEVTQQIEFEMGRKRETRWGERIIDIDLLYANDLIIELPQLTIPHPEMQNRKFTLIPLSEIAPNLHHPLLKKTSLEMLSECTDLLRVNIYKLDAST